MLWIEGCDWCTCTRKHSLAAWHSTRFSFSVYPCRGPIDYYPKVTYVYMMASTTPDISRLRVPRLSMSSRLYNFRPTCIAVTLLFRVQSISSRISMMVSLIYRRGRVTCACRRSSRIILNCTAVYSTFIRNGLFETV